MFDLKNKVIVITGATGVLASSLALSLAKNKACLVLLGRNQKLLDELTKKINQYTVVENYTADVLKKSDLEKVCKKVVKSFDRIDVLVNAVGGNLPGAVIPDSKSIFDLSEISFSARGNTSEFVINVVLERAYVKLQTRPWPCG